ncbi:MAG TPA: hypothetical protein VLX91_08910 [Candidatus Acidoferrales bacterium]|nr:hypothetical protein [Candidatus Acidoferrales bacterium]
MTKVKREFVHWDKETMNLPPDITKTDMERIIPLPGRLLEHFKVLKQKCHARPFLPDRSTITQHWQPMREGGKYGGKDHKGTDIMGTLYDLRKTAETELKNIGLNQDYMDILLGHKRRNIPKDHYTNYKRDLPVVKAALENSQHYIFQLKPMNLNSSLIPRKIRCTMNQSEMCSKNWVLLFRKSLIYSIGVSSESPSMQGFPFFA